MDTYGDSTKFLDLWSNCGLLRRVEPGAAAQNWTVGRRTVYNEAVELAADRLLPEFTAWLLLRG